MLTGENGILNKAGKAKEEYEKSAEKEQEDLEKLYSSIKVAEDSQVTLTMKELDKYIEEKMKENLFTGTELLEEPAMIETTTSQSPVSRNKDFTIENSIEDYEFLLFTFGPRDEATGKVYAKNTLLIPVNKIEYSPERESTGHILSSSDGYNYSIATILFKNDTTINFNNSKSSNSGRKYFVIESIQGIK